MPRNITVNQHDFYCTCCGRKGIPVARTARQLKEPGHLKKLYCLHCKKETNHAEVRPGSWTYGFMDFKLEYELGRFVDGKRIPVSELMECSHRNCEFNRHGKCWNANYSYDCGHRPHKTIEEVMEELK